MEVWSDNKASIHKAKTFKLAKKLKSLCYANGKERDVKQSAKVIHQLGRAYQEIADELSEGRDKKISLIRSAVLLNAAVVRKPDSVAEVEKHLDELCSRVLQLAGSHDTSFKELVEASVTKVKDFRCWIKDIALRAISLAETDQRRASLIESLQNITTEKYKWLMADIMEFCVEATGPAPCKYALVGMGSLARNEITPYSDFEHIYLLEEGVQNRSDYEEILEYFRWVSVMFQVVVVNFGETIIPSVALPFINDQENDQDWFFDAHTPRGISFDGMMPHACKFPLGRSATPDKPWDTELIKPISKMLEYLGRDIDIKNGYHLGDILTKICFVCGDDAIYDQMKKETIDILQQHSFDENLEKQLKEDTEKFNIDTCLTLMHEENSVNIKSVVFRSVTLFIAALGRRYDCKSSSSFDILRELTPSQISQQQSDDFMFALAFACEIRLRVYFKYSGQCDYLDRRFEPFHDLLIKAFGKSRIVDFFLLASSLQMFTIKKWEFKESTWMRVIFSLMSLRLYNEAIVVLKKFRNINIFETQEKKGHISVISYFEGLAHFKLHRHEIALNCFQRAFDHYRYQQQMRARTLYKMGLCYTELGKNLDAIKCYEKVLYSSCRDTISQEVQCDLLILYVEEKLFEEAGDMVNLVLNNKVSTVAQLHISRYYLAIGKYKESIEYGEKHLHQCRIRAFDETSDNSTAVALMYLCKAYLATKNYAEAESKVEMAENILKNRHYVLNFSNNIPADCKELLGEIHFQKSDFLRANNFFKEAYELYPSSKQFQHDRDRVRDKMNLSIAMNKNDMFALDQLEKSPTVCDGHQRRATIAQAKLIAGNRLKELERFEEAYTIIKSSLGMFLGLPKTVEWDFWTGKSFLVLIECMYHLNKHEQVVANFKTGQEYIKQLSQEQRKHLPYLIGRSYQILGNFESAVKCFEQEIELHSTSEPDKEVARFIADCHLYIGQSYLQMKLHEKAMQSLKTAIKLWRKINHSLASKRIKECNETLKLAKRALKPKR